MRNYRMPYDLPKGCSSFSCSEVIQPTSYEVDVLPNPYDSMQSYFDGTPIPSFASEAIYNDIDCNGVTRYAKDTFEAIRALEHQQSMQSASDKRAKQSAEKASAMSADKSE